MTKYEKKVKGKVKPNLALDGEDAELLAAIENDEIEPKAIDDLEAHNQLAKRAAQRYFAKDERVSFRISSADLYNLKRMAAMEGLPYQTFLTSIIHKYTTGQLSNNS